MALTQVPVSMVDFSVNPTLSGGTANGVAYLNGSKVVTTGSALTFDGTNLGLSSSAVATAIKIDGSGRYKQFETYQSGSREFYFGYDSTSLIGLIYQDNNRPIAFGISGSEQMRLTSTGLGIGTSSPSQKLTVSGSAAFSRIGFNANAIDTVSTSQSFVRFQSTGADFYLGTESSTGGAFFPGSTAYAAVLYNANSTPMHFYTNAGLRMTLDSSGNLGIGTSSPTVNLHVYNASSAEIRIASANIGLQLYSSEGAGTSVIGTYTNHALVFRTNATERARIDSSGNLLIGTTSSDGSRLRVYGSYQTLGDGSYEGLIGKASSLVSGGGAGEFAIRSSSNLLFATNGNTERARIDSSGNLLVGTTSSGDRKLYVKGTPATAAYISSLENTTGTGANAFGLQIYYSGASPNGAGNQFLECQDSTTVRFRAYSNGGLANYSANNVNLSDRREKTNFAPAGEYLSKICAIPVQTFNYIDQAQDDPGLTLGVVAQDVQAVAPELVMESNWGTKEEPKMRLSIYQTDLQYALMKCIQEQQALITQLTERITALEGK